MSVDAHIIDEVIAVFREAAEANLATAPRQGSVVTLGADAEDLVVGADLHGHRLNYQRILRLADLGRHPRRHLVLQEVCHGGPTFPDARACMSHLMLEDVARLKLQHRDQVHFLLSNHELAELLEQPIIKGSRMLNLQFRFGMEKLYGAATDEVRAAAIQFIRSCPLAVKTPNRIWVSHSAPEQVAERGFDETVFARPPDADDLAPGGAAFRLVWGRDFRQSNADAFAELVGCELLVHGHEPCDTGYRIANSRQLILDSSKAPACCLIVGASDALTMDALVGGVRFL